MHDNNILTPPSRGETLSRYVIGIVLLSMLVGPWINDIQPIWSQWSNGSTTNQALITFLLFKILFVAVQLCFLYVAVFRPMTLHAEGQRHHDAFVEEIQTELAALRIQLDAVLPPVENRSMKR